jgi:hypothetical protein
MAHTAPPTASGVRYPSRSPPWYVRQALMAWSGRLVAVVLFMSGIHNPVTPGMSEAALGASCTRSRLLGFPAGMSHTIHTRPLCPPVSSLPAARCSLPHFPPSPPHPISPQQPSPASPPAAPCPPHVYLVQCFGVHPGFDHAPGAAEHPGRVDDVHGPQVLREVVLGVDGWVGGWGLEEKEVWKKMCLVAAEWKGGQSRAAQQGVVMRAACWQQGS